MLKWLFSSSSTAALYFNYAYLFAKLAWSSMLHFLLQSARPSSQFYHWLKLQRDELSPPTAFTVSQVPRSANGQAREAMLFCAFSKTDLTLTPCVSELAVSSIREGVELSPLTKELSIQWVGA